MTDSEHKPQLDDFDKMDEIASSLKKQMSKLSGSQSYEVDDNVDEDVYYQPASKAAAENNSKDLLSTYNLKFVLTGLVGLLIFVSALGYFFLSEGEEGKGSQQQSIALPDDPENSLNNNKSKADSGLYLTPENNRVKKIPLTYVEGEDANDGLNEEKIVEDEIATVDLSKPGKTIALPINDKLVDKANQTAANTDETIAPPVLKQIKPNIVIGSHSWQKIILKGNNFTQSTQVQLSWRSGSSQKTKTFSATKTSAQFSFINENEIQLRLTTGINASEWQLYAINQGVKSNLLSFEVTPPFSAKKEATKQAAIERVTTEKETTKKVSSQNNTPQPHEQLSAGTEKSNNTSSIATKSSASSILLSPSSNYTIQLMGSSTASSIKQLIAEHNNVKPLELVSSKRDGADWYVLLYGSFKSKAQASNAYQSLPSRLKKNKPWIRSLESVQKQQGLNVKPDVSQQDKSNSPTTTAKPSTQTKVIADDPSTQSTSTVITKSSELVTNEQKILTINPLRWTLQLLSTSSLLSLKQYIEKHHLESKSYFYQQIVNGEEQFSLIYGAYSSKSNAQFAIQKLPKDIQVAKPWVRKYQDIHKLIK